MDQLVHPGDAVNLMLMASQSSNDPLTYTAVNLPPGVALDSATGSIVGAIDANADLANPYAAAVTATDEATGEFASQGFNWYVSPATPPAPPAPTLSAAELYATYFAAVSQAGQTYLAGMTDAAAARDDAEAAITVSENVTHDQLAGAYAAALDSAGEAYRAVHDSAKAVMDAAVAEAETIVNARLDVSEANQATALAAAQAILDETNLAAETTYQQALQAAETSYADTLTPYQTAWDTAGSFAAANPDDPDAQSALAQATQAFADAQISAAAIRDAARIDALTSQQSALAAAQAIYQTQVESAHGQFESDAAAAQQEYDSAENAAWDAFEAIDEPAQQTRDQAQEAAWNAFESAVANIDAAQQNAADAAQSQYAVASSSALDAFTAAEQSAWDAYLGGLATLPNAPAPEARLASPPTNEPAKSGDNEEVIVIAPPPQEGGGGGDGGAVVLGPTISPIANQINIEGRAVSLAVSATDPNRREIAYSVQGLPDGLTINTRSGVVSGTLPYGPAGVYTVTITAANTLGASDSVTFTWTVTGVSIGTFKATELHNGNGLPNWVSADYLTGPSTSTYLWVSPANSVRLEIIPSPGVERPLWAAIRFAVEGVGASIASRDFSANSWPNLSFTGEQGTYIVKVGIDANRNGVLDPAEVSRQLFFCVVTFDGATIASQRIGGGSAAESQSFSIANAERYDVGSNFKFEIKNGIVSNSNSMVRFEMEKSHGINQGVIDSGWGTSFSHTFAANDKGRLWVRFYVDSNGNGVRDRGEDQLESRYFFVVDRRVFNLTVNVSSGIPNHENFANTVIRGLFEDAQNRLLRKDSDRDYRAAVQINITFLGYFAGPDPVTNADERWELYGRAANFVFVNSLVGSMGRGRMNYLRSIVGNTENIVAMDATATLHNFGGTIAHELGHNVGLDHIRPDDPNRVMTELGGGTASEVTQSEARAFDVEQQPGPGWWR